MTFDFTDPAAVFLARGWNNLAKVKRLGDLTFALDHHPGQLQYFARCERYGHAHETNRISPEIEAQARRWYTIERDWLKANPGDDMAAVERAAQWSCAAEAMRKAGQTYTTLNGVIDLDDWSQYSTKWDEASQSEKPIEKSATHQAAEKKHDTAVIRLQEILLGLLTVDQVAVLRKTSYINLRRRRLYRLWQVMTFSGSGAFNLIDVRLSPKHWPSFSADFEKCIEGATTLRQVKTVCDCWLMPTRTVRVDGHSMVIAEEEGRDGLPLFVIRPPAVDDARARKYVGAWHKAKNREDVKS